MEANLGERNPKKHKTCQTGRKVSQSLGGVCSWSCWRGGILKGWSWFPYPNGEWTHNTQEKVIRSQFKEKGNWSKKCVWNKNLLLIPKQPEMRAHELMRLLTPWDMGIMDLCQGSSDFPSGPLTGYEGASKTIVPCESKAVFIREGLFLRWRLTKCQRGQMFFIKHLAKNLSKEECLDREQLSVTLDFIARVPENWQFCWEELAF